jgi:hypothetical protein
MTEYQSYTDIIENGKNRTDMNYSDRQRLIKNIDLLDTKDHIGILKIIMESSKQSTDTDNSRKIYTVNNYGTYFDLNDLDNNTLWKISYHVSLSLENLKRDEFRKVAEKQYNDDRSNLEDKLRNMDAKLKLTSNRSTLKPDTFKKSTPLTKENIDSHQESNHHSTDYIPLTPHDNEDYDLLPGPTNNDLTLLSNYSLEDDLDIIKNPKITYDDED